MAYDWPCNNGCTFNERHLGHCSTLDAQEEMAVAIIKASTSAVSACVFCKTAFATSVPKLHPASCAIHAALPKFWAALPYILK
jgi:hypothetical protein